MFLVFSFGLLSAISSSCFYLLFCNIWNIEEEKHDFILTNKSIMFYKIYAFLKQFMLQILLLSNNPLDSDKIHLLMTGGRIHQLTCA